MEPWSVAVDVSSGIIGNMGGVLGVLLPVAGITPPTRREICDAADIGTGGIVAIINGVVLGARFSGPSLGIASRVTLKLLRKIIVVAINLIAVVLQK